MTSHEMTSHEFIPDNDVFNGDGIRIKLNQPDDFNKIRESLTRIGVPARGNVLWQSCHILSSSFLHQ